MGVCAYKVMVIRSCPQLDGKLNDYCWPPLRPSPPRAMIQSDGMVDVVNKRCQHPGCKKRPVFGFEGEKGRFCSLHRSGVRAV